MSKIARLETAGLYKELSSSELSPIPEDTELQLPRRHNRLRPLYYLAATVLGITAIAVLLTAGLAIDTSLKFNRFMRSHGLNSPPPEHKKQPCGTTWREAKANGCIFDPIQVAWVTPECHDKELVEEFIQQGPWTFWPCADDGTINKESPYESHEKVGESPNGQFWGTRRFHIFHCTYSMKLYERAVENQWKISDGMTGEHHVNHCVEIIGNSSMVPPENIDTRSWIAYPDCISMR